MQNTFGRTQQLFWWRLFKATSKQFKWFIALGPQGGESISYQEMIQCFSGWGKVQIATLSRLRDVFPYGWNVFLSSSMLNRALKGFLPWFRHLQQDYYVRLMVWSLSRRGINIRYNPCTMKAMVISLYSASEPLLSSLYAHFKELYTVFCWHRSQIAPSGTSATRLTWILSSVSHVDYSTWCVK